MSDDQPKAPPPASPHPATYDDLPLLLTPEEVRILLRKDSVAAVYLMKARGQLPGVIQESPRRWLVDRVELVRWLRKRRAPSPNSGGAGQ